MQMVNDTYRSYRTKIPNQGSWLYIGFFYIDFFDCFKYLSGSVFLTSLSKDRVILGGTRISLHISVEMDI